MISLDSTKFSGHRHCGSGDMMVLVCQVISDNHVTKGSFDFMGRIPSKSVIILPSLVAIGTVIRLREQGSSKSNNIIGRRPSRLVTIMPLLVAIDTVRLDILWF